MKVRHHHYLQIPFSIVIFLCSVFVAQSQDPAQAKAVMLTRFIQLNHINPKPVDDEFSKAIFDQLIKMLDRRKGFFLEEDIKLLSAFRTGIDEEVNGAAWQCLPRLSTIYKKRLAMADSLIKGILQKPFTYPGKEYILLNPDSLKFSTNRNDWINKWSRIIKYDILINIFMLKQQEAEKKTPARFADLETKAKEAVENYKRKELKKIPEAPGGVEGYVTNAFFSSLSHYFDPHTDYLPAYEKAAFQNKLAGLEYSAGIELDENEQGEKIIARLVPGGSAWRSNEIHKGNVIVKIGVAGKPEEEVELLNMEDVYELLLGDKEEKLDITIRTTDGSLKKVLLKKEQIKNDENFVKGFLLSGAKKIGYIDLPGFYTDVEQENGSSCANDVAKEILKLKKENIEGLILDLRFNGGGSMGEAMELAGIFINEGPLCAVKERATGKTKYIKDMNRGAAYDGPLIVLVNESSASASEMLSSVLQDYNRALIVGNRTYGKGSMQEILALDTTRKTTEVSSDGYVKLTIGKFYRISGETVQQKGVVPDIQWPGFFDQLPIREADKPYALPADTAKKGLYTPLPALPAAVLNQKSKERQQQTDWYKMIIQYREYIKGIKTKKIELTEQSVEAHLQSLSALQAQVEKIMEKPATTFTCSVTDYDKSRWKLVPEKLEATDTWLKNLQADVQLEEAYLIMLDYLQTKNK